MKRFFQTKIVTLLVVTMLCASFAAGYRKGFENRPAFADFDELIRLIEGTVVPSEWEALGGPSTMAPYPNNITDGCLLTAEVVIAPKVIVHDETLPAVDNAAVSEPSIDEDQP